MTTLIIFCIAVFLLTRIITNKLLPKEENDTSQNNTVCDDDYVDLGLPSGTIWSKYALSNDGGVANIYIKHTDIVDIEAELGVDIPTEEDYWELFENCTCIWNKDICGIEFTSHINGNKLFMKAHGLVLLNENNNTTVSQHNFVYVYNYVKANPVDIRGKEEEIKNNPILAYKQTNFCDTVNQVVDIIIPKDAIKCMTLVTVKRK